MAIKKPGDEKQSALEKHAALNRYPQRVKDKLFDQDNFFRCAGPRAGQI